MQNYMKIAYELSNNIDALRTLRGDLWAHENKPDGEAWGAMLELEHDLEATRNRLLVATVEQSAAVLHRCPDTDLLTALDNYGPLGVVEAIKVWASNLPADIKEDTVRDFRDLTESLESMEFHG